MEGWNLVSWNVDTETYHYGTNQGLSGTYEFYYATLGYYVSDPMFVFISYWFTKEFYPPYTIKNNPQSKDLKIKVPNIGISYNLWELE